MAPQGVEGLMDTVVPAGSPASTASLATYGSASPAFTGSTSAVPGLSTIRTTVTNPLDPSGTQLIVEGIQISTLYRVSWSGSISTLIVTGTETLANQVITFSTISGPTTTPTPNPTPSSGAPYITSTQYWNGSTTATFTAAAPNGTSPGIVILEVPNANRTTTDGDSGISAGAIAGASIGCLIAGIILGLLAAVLFFRRRHNNSSHFNGSTVAHKDTPASSAAAVPIETKGSPPAHDGGSILLGQHLLDSSPDKEVADDMASLTSLLQQHVDNYYHLQPVQINAVDLSYSLRNLGVGTSGALTHDAIAALAIDPRTRQTAIQHVLSSVLFGSVDVDRPSRLSMLPAPVAAFLASMPATERSGGSEEAISTALHRWRTLSAFLLHPTRSQRTPLIPSETALQQQSSGLVSALDSFLRPFVAPGEQLAQEQHLEAVVLEVATFGYKVFSQPVQWRYTWEEVGQGGSGVRMVTICPGLSKVLSKGHVSVVVQPVVVRT